MKCQRGFIVYVCLIGLPLFLLKGALVYTGIPPHSSTIKLTSSSFLTGEKAAVQAGTVEGYLARTFGSNGTGTVYTPFDFILGGGNYNEAFACTVQSNGYILAAGSSTIQVIGDDGTYAYSVARFLPNGMLDTSFGRVGTARAGTACLMIPGGIAGGSYDMATGVVLQQDGKIILAGLSKDGVGNSHFSLARFLSNGQADTSFGTQATGATYLNIAGGIAGGNSDFANGCLIQPDDKIILFGVSSDGGHIYFSVARFLPNGQPDTTFGGAGTGATYINIPGGIAGGNDDACRTGALQPDGKIILAGFSTSGGGGSYYSVARFLSNGQLDRSFGGHGTGATYLNIPGGIAGGDNDAAIACALQSDGSIVLAGASADADGNGRFSIARFLPNGQPDLNFGTHGTGGTYFNPTGGIVGGANEGAASCSVQSNGNIVLGGYAALPDAITFRFAAVRFLSSGQVDQTFGQVGTRRAGSMYIPFNMGPPGSVRAIANAGILQSNGLLVMAGSCGGGVNAVYYGLAQVVVDQSLSTFITACPGHGGFY